MYRLSIPQIAFGIVDHKIQKAIWGIQSWEIQNAIWSKEMNQNRYEPVNPEIDLNKKRIQKN